MILIRPAVVNDAAFVSSTIAETDYAAWSSVTTYALAARVIVVAADVHKVYESVQAANINHDPQTSPTWWLEVGNTNRWKMFDSSVTSQSTAVTSITTAIKPDSRVDAIALLNVVGKTVVVTMTDVTDGLVYNQTFNLVSDSGITDWYGYFFEPIIRKPDLLVLDLPPYYSPTITVTISADTGETVAIGALVLGQQKEIGGTEYGGKIGISDYSVKQQDSFGNYTILERAFNKKASFDVMVEAGFVDQLQNILAGYRAIPIVYVGSTYYNATVVYGFYKDFSITIAYPSYSVCSIDIEGLT